MKRILIVNVIITVFFAACTKNLEEHPKGIVSENFYNTSTEVEQGLNAIYGQLKNGAGMGSQYQAVLEAYGDYVYGRGSFSNINEYKGLDNTNTTRSNGVYYQFYRAISIANICLERIPESNILTEKQKLNYIAEARFLRGLTYFNLVRCFDGVPLRTEANINEKYVAPSSSSDIYKFLLTDLKFAEENLPETPRLIGAPSVWVAKTVLTEVYLWLKDWKNARDMSLEVIQSEVFSLVPVSTSADFQKIYGPDLVNTPEEIFYLKFSRQAASYGFGYTYMLTYPGDGRHGGGGNYALYTDTVLNQHWRNWNNKDLRKKFNWYPRNIGLGNHTLLANKFSDPSAVGQNNAGNDYPWYKYSNILLWYAEAESRVNGAPNALAIEALNKVHRRAYGYPPNNPSVVDFKLTEYTLDSFIDLVTQERCYEDCMEAKRWFDLKRLGIEKQVVLKNKGKTVTDQAIYWTKPY